MINKWLKNAFVLALALLCNSCISHISQSTSLVLVEDLSFDLEIANKTTNKYVFDISQKLLCKPGDELEVAIIIDYYYPEATYALTTAFYDENDTVLINSSSYKKIICVPESITKGTYPILVELYRSFQDSMNNQLLKMEQVIYTKKNDSIRKFYTIQVD